MFTFLTYCIELLSKNWHDFHNYLHVWPFDNHTDFKCAASSAVSALCVLSREDVKQYIVIKLYLYRFKNVSEKDQM